MTPSPSVSRYDERRQERIARRLEELRAWRDAREHPITDWSFTAGGTNTSLMLGDFWPVVATPVQFAASGDVPEAWAGEPVELELWLGGEGFLQLSTGFQAGLDPFHHSFPISDAARGGEQVASDPEVVPHLLDIVEAAFAIYGPAWPSASDTAVSRLALGYVNPIGSGVNTISGSYGVEAYDVHPYSSPIWHLPPPPLPLEPLPAAALEAVRAARTEVAQRLERLKQDYPPVGRLAVTGHAHIDLAWLWPVAETRRKGRRTFATVL